MGGYLPCTLTEKQRKKELTEGQGDIKIDKKQVLENLENYLYGHLDLRKTGDDMTPWVFGH